jgi:hypothetical protein
MNGSYDSTSTAAQNTRLTKPILQFYNSPDAKPENFAVSNGFKSLNLSWTTGDVSYTPATPVIPPQTPDQVLIIVFKPDAANVSLNAYKATNTPNIRGTPATTCNFNGDDACISCPDAWIDDIQNGNENIQFIGLEPNNGSFLVRELTPDENYTVVLQYRQGVKRTECLVGIPKINYSVSELNGGEASRPGDPRCFIVSAAFDSPFNRHVDIFRWFRDTFLEPSSLGHDFVEFYYNHSQPFADLIKSSSFLQFVVRLFLYPLAFVLYGLQESIEYPLLVSTLFVSLIMLFFWMRRRKLTRC